MIYWTRLTVLSSLAFVPAILVLASFASWFVLPALASLLVCMCYHASWETKLGRLDHALAYSVIAGNAYMLWHARVPAFGALGMLFVLVGLWRYALARRVEGAYEIEHSLWHLCCGAANLCFAVCYVG